MRSVQIIRRNCKNSFRVYACCFVNNTETYFCLFVCPCKLRGMSVRTRVSIFNFDLLHTVRGSWPDSTIIIEESPSSHLCLLCKSSVTTRYEALPHGSCLCDVLGQIGIHFPFSSYRNLKSSA